jgi:hypothetical protein
VYIRANCRVVRYAAFAPNEELIRKHAEKAGIPANRISEVKIVVEPPAGE